ncbi:MAG TPA: HAMP domain-containing protein, partial [Thermoanaerobaculia bacterium]
MVLLVLGASFTRSSSWTGVIGYSVLGLGLLVSSVPYRDGLPGSARGDLFAFVMGIDSALLGIFAVGLPQHFPIPPPPHFREAGLALLLTGPPLALAQRGSPPRWLLSAIHLLAGAALVAFGLQFSFPARAWTGIAFYVGGGTVVAFLPWLRTRFGALDSTALRTQLALVLAIAMSLALILAVAVVSAQEESLAARQAQEAHQTEVRGVAQDVFDYVRLNGARAATVAAMAGRLPMTAAAQQTLLARTGLPEDAAALFVRDPRGEGVAQLGHAALEEGSLADAARGAQGGRTALSIAVERGTRHRVLLLAVPIAGLDGRLSGALVSALAPDSLSRRIARPDSKVTMADGHGLQLAESDGARGSEAAESPARNPRQLPPDWDSRWRQGQPAAADDRLIAYAPVPTFGWVVVSERSRELALAGVRRGRDWAFGLLLLVLPLAAGGGIVAARRITRPLGTLADAADEMTAGNPGAPLEASEITEVARLSAAFGTMRDRLAPRTAESERLAGELLARAEALAES